MAGEPRCRPGPMGGGLSGRLTPLWPAAPGGGRQGGQERLEQPPERDALVSLAREEHAVDGGQPEVRQLVSGRLVRVVTEGRRASSPRARQLSTVAITAARRSRQPAPARGGYPAPAPARGSSLARTASLPLTKCCLCGCCGGRDA